MKILIAFLALVLSCATMADTIIMGSGVADYGAASDRQWVGGVYCKGVEVERELVRRILDEMDLPPETADNIWIFCAPHLPSTLPFRGQPGLSLMEIGHIRFPDCPPDHWSYLMGCLSGLSKGGSAPGWLLAVRVHPAMMDKIIAVAKANGMSPWPYTWEDLRCHWTLNRLMVTLTHELNHHIGHSHNAAMEEADEVLQEAMRRKHGAWMAANDNC